MLQAAPKSLDHTQCGADVAVSIKEAVLYKSAVLDLSERQLVAIPPGAKPHAAAAAPIAACCGAYCHSASESIASETDTDAKGSSTTPAFSHPCMKTCTRCSCSSFVSLPHHTCACTYLAVLATQL